MDGSGAACRNLASKMKLSVNGRRKVGVRAMLFSGTHCCIDHSIKFFRSAAEFERWQEQVEIKHAELHRAVKYFLSFQTIWLELANASPSAGHLAYARCTAAMYGGLKAEIEDIIKQVALPKMRTIPHSATLADQALAWREKEIAAMSKKYR
jgi:hypothetical protein